MTSEIRVVSGYINDLTSLQKNTIRDAVGPGWRVVTLSLQMMALILLTLSLIGQIRPAESLTMLRDFGPEGVFLLICLLLHFVGKFLRLSGALPLVFALIAAVTAICHLLTGAGIVAWVMLVILAGTALLLSGELLLLRLAGRNAFWLIFLANTITLIWLYLDRMLYTVSKTHLSLNHLAQVFQMGGYFKDALIFSGKGYFIFLGEIMVFVLATIPAAMLLEIGRKKPENQPFRAKLVVLCVTAVVFFTTLLRFDSVCIGLPVLDYLPLRLDLGILPVPDHPRLRDAPELHGLLQQKIEVATDRIFPDTTLENGPDFKNINLVMISVESLRRQEFTSLMSKTLAYAEKGLWLRNHFSVSNISLSSFHSIFRSSFPLNLAFSANDQTEIPLQKFFTDLGYDSYLITPADIVMPMQNFWGKRHITAVAPNMWQTTPAVLAKASELLAQPQRKVIHAYLYNLHFNYFYPESAERCKPVIDADTNLFLLQPDQENLRGLNNRYANAAFYADTVISSFLQQAEAAGHFADTLFVIFGDHGESLGEAGFIAHATGPHVKQFEVPVFLIGAGITPKTIDSPTTHADLLPIIADLMGIKVSRTFGSSIGVEKAFPILQLDESVTGRVIVRHRDYMSIFDLANGNQLKWLATISNEFSIDESVYHLYAADSFAELARVIAADTSFIRKSIGSDSELTHGQTH